MFFVVGRRAGVGFVWGGSTPPPAVPHVELAPLGGGASIDGIACRVGWSAFQKTPAFLIVSPSFGGFARRSRVRSEIGVAPGKLGVGDRILIGDGWGAVDEAFERFGLRRIGRYDHGGKGDDERFHFLSQVGRELAASTGAHATVALTSVSSAPMTPLMSKTRKL